MRLARVRRVLRRSDLRASLWIGSVLLVAVASAGTWYYAYSAIEALEEADRWFEFVLGDLVSDLEERAADGVGIDSSRRRLGMDASVRVFDEEGAFRLTQGRWPDAQDAVPATLHDAESDRRDKSAIRLLKRNHWLVGDRITADGWRVELALPLRHFASEHEEIGRALLSSALTVVATAYLLGLIVTIRAFAPLRQATRQIREVDLHRLRLRLPSRGTGDPIDAHAETLNRVLREIDAGFARLRAFSSDAAHELRTPLNRIATVTEVALLQGGELELREALESVDRTVGELSRVVQSLLLLSEIDERDLSPTNESIEVAPWLEHHAAAYTAPFEEAGIELAVHADDVTICGDRTLLDRVIANLLDNALDHAPPGTRVDVGASQQGDGVVVTVDDAGPGIAEKDRERVFDRFARLDAAKRPGHGLGLALARAIASLHGGSLHADASPTGGARFELWMPKAAAPRRAFRSDDD